MLPSTVSVFNPNQEKILETKIYTRKKERKNGYYHIQQSFTRNPTVKKT
jgi:hypothetical protein